ncbi:ABC transporter substrate-binding protein [Psychromonas aquatilis]|uniref:ABC transporter substrate-binding protein n=1 Tax=Psychromonas aquatilis TaxID=2005072 RepID=A0ABU9GPL5_9GAMM
MMLLHRLLLLCFFSSMSYLVQADSSFDDKSITVAIDKIPLSFNPFSAPSLMDEQFKHLVFDPLFRWGSKKTIEPRLVKSWKRLDSQTVRFNLHENIHFHSGNLLTAKDVKWSFEQAVKEPSMYFLANIDDFKVNDDNSFDIRSPYNDHQLLDYLTHLFVLDSAYYSENTNLLTLAPSIILPPYTDKNLPLSGTGPYLIQQYNEMLGLVVSKNEQYWAEKPQIKYIRFMKVDEPQSRLFALLADDVQVSYGVPNKEAVEFTDNTLKNLVKVSSSNIIFLTINDNKSPVLQNNKAREALHLAINQPGILKYVLKNNGQVSSVSMPVKNARDAKNQTMPEYDLTKSKALLNKLNLPKQLTLLVLADEAGYNHKIAVALSKMLKMVDIEVVFNETDSLDIWNTTLEGYDLTLSSWRTHLMDVYNVDEALFKNSTLATYLNNKSLPQAANDHFDSQSKAFEFLQQNNWVIPMFYQDDIWAQSRAFNLADIFSSNDIPYWSLFKTVGFEEAG